MPLTHSSTRSPTVSVTGSALPTSVEGVNVTPPGAAPSIGSVDTGPGGLSQRTRYARSSAPSNRPPAIGRVSAPPTTGAYRTAAQAASAQVLLAKGLKVEYLTRNAANAVDMFSFWPSDAAPTHLIACIEGGRSQLTGDADTSTYAPGDKFNPSVQRIDLATGAVETILRGMTACDGIRTTPWGTVLATEETDDGGAYEILDPLAITNYTVKDSDIRSVMVSYALNRADWNALAVLRNDDNSQFGNFNNWALSGGYKLTQSLRAVASVGTSFQAPSFNQLYFPGFGTPTLTPQQNRGGEIGLKYNQGALSMGAVAYYNEVQGFINPATNVQNSLAVLRGVSLSLQAQRGDTSYSVSYDLSLIHI